MKLTHQFSLYLIQKNGFYRSFFVIDMMKPFLRFFTVVALVFLLHSCDSNDPVPDESRVGFQFFPLQVGQSSIYDVEEINYLITGVPDTNQFRLKVDVVDSFISQSGELNYVINRFKQQEDETEFTFLETWSARINANNAIEIEGAVPFVRISFPLDVGRTWDGNSLNVLDEDMYEMDSLFAPYITVNQDTIDRTITVIQGDNQDFVVALDRRFEVYGEGVGLVYREDIQLSYCTEDDCINQQIVESGREFRQTLVSHVKK